MKTPLFILLATITVLLLVAGFSGLQLYGVVGAVLFFFLAFTILSGNLGLPDGTVETVDDSTNTTMVEKQYEAWDYGDYKLAGWVLTVLSVVTFAMFLIGGDR